MPKLIITCEWCGESFPASQRTYCVAAIVQDISGGWRNVCVCQMCEGLPPGRRTVDVPPKLHLDNRVTDGEKWTFTK